MHEDDGAPERPSKTRRKQDMQALQDLGRQLAETDAALLDKLDLPERLRGAIDEYRRLPNSREARRRQLQFIGRLMRDADTAEIHAVLDRAQQNSAPEAPRLHRLEDLRARLIAGDDAVEELIDAHPGIEVQPLRQLIRQARRERDENKPPAASRKLFRYLRELLAGE